MEYPSDPAKRLILLALADFANDEGVCWPKIETLSKKTRVCDKWTRETLNEFVDSGVLVRAKNWKSYTYTLNLDSSPVLSTGDQRYSVPVITGSQYRRQENPHRNRHKEPLAKENKAAKPKAADLIWDAALKHCDDVVTAVNRGKLNRDVKALKDLGATAYEIKVRADLARSKWTSGIPVTIHALAKNWHLLGDQKPPEFKYENKIYR